MSKPVEAAMQSFLSTHTFLTIAAFTLALPPRTFLTFPGRASLRSLTRQHPRLDQQEHFPFVRMHLMRRCLHIGKGNFGQGHSTVQNVSGL